MRISRITLADPVRAAVLGLALLAVIVAASLNLSRLPVIGAGPQYRANFLDAAGLQNGEEVRVAGIKVGAVTDIDLDGDHVVVSFRVKGQRLGRDTRASIEIKTLLGQHFLAVQPAGPGELPAGSTIPLERTSTPMQIVPTLQKLARISGDIDATQLAGAFDALSDALHGTAPEVRGTLDGLTALSRTIASRDAQIKELFARANSVTGVLSSRDTEIGQIITASNQVLDVLSHRRAAIHDLLIGTRELSTQLSGLVGDNAAQLRPALDKLAAVTDVLQRNDDNLNKILTQLAPHLRSITNLTGTGPFSDNAANTANTPGAAPSAAFGGAVGAIAGLGSAVAGTAPEVTNGVGSLPPPTLPGGN